MRTKCWSADLNGTDHLEDLDVYGSIILKRVLGKCGLRIWIGFLWLQM